MSSFTGWRVLVNFLLPPPMLLTFLLVLPFPRNVRKGLLLFTSKVLNFPVLGGIRFVHMALILSGVPLADSGFRTFKSAQEALDHELTPNQRVSVLAKKWREERNFWIAAMAFTLWCLLTVLYAQVGQALRVHDALDRALAELNELKGIEPATPATTKMSNMAGNAASNVAGAASNVAGRLGFGKKKGSGDMPEQCAVGEGGNATEPLETELTPAGPAAGGARRRAVAKA
ncbi:hypothetical protein OEZ85_006908 [Tetradesmus obliquus]|uniref:BAP29/BAP31 transmembrane domain-containing protein n=1 Tax=Tetradesmus obliquus TaxID=3088 RepID=A0ABY8TWI2_TETOB|nr:hypothetical protein OEZ85_006908 [Tetradesmus obliquus]